MSKVIKYEGKLLEFTYKNPNKQKCYSRLDDSYKTLEEWMFTYEDLVVIGVDFTRNYHVLSKKISKKGNIGLEYIYE